MNNSELLPLTSSRLVLRRFAAADVEAFFAYRNDPKIARYQSWEGIELAAATEFVRHHQSQEAGVPGEWLQIAVALKDTNALIGDCAVKVQAHDPRQATIGGTLARRFQRQGFAVEALSCLLDGLFERLKLHRVGADTDVENTAAWTLMEQLGLRREGHLRQSLWFKGRWADEYLYAIRRDEWLARHPSARGLNDLPSGARSDALETARLWLQPSHRAHWRAWRQGQAAFTREFKLRVADSLAGLPGWVQPEERDDIVAAEWDSFYLVHRREQMIVGACACRRQPDATGAVEIAYGLAPEFQGHGLATEAARALTERALRCSDVKAVYANTLPEFNASTRVLLKCGFARAGESIDLDEGTVWRWEKRQG